MPRYDLHCHSTFSDGVLPPAEVVQRAASRGVDVLALTDHDEVSGLGEAREAAQASAIAFVNGTEISVSWRDLTIHVVGLRVDPEDAALTAGLEVVRNGRDSRARRIGAALAQAGIPGAFEGALSYVTSERLITRTHFARFLVEGGYSRNVKDVFKHYLVPGKPGYVEHEWATLADAVGWIHGAGGDAVIAHPARYKVTRLGMRELLGEFRDAGGDAIEVLSSSHTLAQRSEYASLARVFGFKASSGSDFHAPGEGPVDLGDLPPLPAGVTPVWANW
jgi:predicted metal-dependent phosphoesterase TrpH